MIPPEIYGLMIGAIALGFVHGIEPGHGWPVAASYALDKKNKWFHGFAASSILGIGHLISSIAMVAVFFYAKNYFNLTQVNEPIVLFEGVNIAGITDIHIGGPVSLVAGVLLIALGLREYLGGGHSHDHGGGGHDGGHDDHSHDHGGEEHIHDGGHDRVTHSENTDEEHGQNHSVLGGLGHGHEHGEDHEHEHGDGHEHGEDHEHEHGDGHEHGEDYEHGDGGGHDGHDHGDHDDDGHDHGHDHDDDGHDHEHGDHEHDGHDHDGHEHDDHDGHDHSNPGLLAKAKSFIPFVGGHSHADGGMEAAADRGLFGIAWFAFVLGFAHEEEFEIIALCAGSEYCLELMTAYALTVIVGIVGLTLLLIAGYHSYEDKVEKYTPYLPAFSAAVLILMGLGFISGLF